MLKNWLKSKENYIYDTLLSLTVTFITHIKPLKNIVKRRYSKLEQNLVYIFNYPAKLENNDKT